MDRYTAGKLPVCNRRRKRKDPLLLGQGRRRKRLQQRKRSGGNQPAGRTPGGDINGDDAVDLADAILTLKVLSGINPGGILLNYPSSGADVNGDGQIGFEEIIHILQKASSLR
jgi:hypothetical protein